MQFTIPVYQKKHGRVLSWTTVGLGPFTRARSGVARAKIEKSLITDLKREIEKAETHKLSALQLKRGTRLVRVRVDLSLQGGGRRRRLSGLLPLILEPRLAGPERQLVIGYHPARQNEWFPVTADVPVEVTASAYLEKTLRELPDDDIERLFTDGKDLLTMIAFSARPPSLMDSVEARKKGLWDDLNADPARRKEKRKSGGMKVLPSLAVNLTSQISSTGAEGMPRSPYRENLLSLLASEPKKPVVVVGAPGSGKTSVIRTAIADLLEQDDFPSHRNLDRVTHVWSLSGKRLIAGMSYVGDWEQRCVDLVDDVRGKRIILFFSDLHRLGRIGKARDSERSLADFFRGPLARGEISILGECSPEQLAMLEEDAPALLSLFVRVPLLPAGAGETFRILLHESRRIEAERWVRFSPHALRATLELAPALLPGQTAPGQAVRLLSDLGRRHELDEEERAAADQPPRIEHADVITLLSEKTGLPRALVAPEQGLEPEDVFRQLSAQVMGQDEAVRHAVDLVMRVKTGLVDPKRPYGVFLFTGPTGTGKTELAKCLAEYLFGSERRLVRFDMGELSGPDAAARLAGDQEAPEGLLTRAAIEQPTSVILLDEIDKAHPSVLGLLLQLFEDARLTDAAGTTASFTHCVIVMTSNLGARSTEPVGFGTSPDRVLADVDRAVREFFPPELFNRIDRVVRFRPLSREVAVDVAEKELSRVLSRRGLADRNVFVRASRAVVERVATLAFEQRDGARSLKRFLEDRIATPLSEVLSRSPQAALRMLWLLDAPAIAGGFSLEDEPVLEAEPLPGVRYVLSEIGDEPVETLRTRLPGLLPVVDQAIAAAQKSGAPRFELDSFLVAAETLKRDLEAYSGLSVDPYQHHEDDADERYDVQEWGSGATYTRRRVRMTGIGGAPRTIATRKICFEQIARAESTRRIARSLAHPEEHSLTLELLSVVTTQGARFSEDPASGAPRASGLLAWMGQAYADTDATVESFAFVSRGKAAEGSGKADLLNVLAGKPELLVVRLSGIGIRDMLGLEEGSHVHQPLARSPEIVRVRSLGSSVAPRKAVAGFLEERAVWDRAVHQGATGTPPSNPSRLSALVRKWRFDPPSRPTVPVAIEVEDYVTGQSLELRAPGLPEALAELLLVRASRRAVSVSPAKETP
jgi:ATP-dependent Clp protease ATP-binding subunit ClpC